MSRATTSTCLTALGIGIALAGAPGPVQAILLAGVVRRGVPRGLRVLTGVHLTFGSLLFGLALGFSVASPHGVGLRIPKLAGGVLLLWLASDGLRARPHPDPAATERRMQPPQVACCRQPRENGHDAIAVRIGHLDRGLRFVVLLTRWRGSCSAS
jgi:threonine/homoserine/homoserine lactone efflux protein